MRSPVVLVLLASAALSGAFIPTGGPSALNTISHTGLRGSGPSGCGLSGFRARAEGLRAEGLRGQGLGFSAVGWQHSGFRGLACGGLGLRGLGAERLGSCDSGLSGQALGPRGRRAEGLSGSGLRCRGALGLKAREKTPLAPPDDWELPESLQVRLPKLRKVGEQWTVGGGSSFVGKPIVFPDLESQIRKSKFTNSQFVSDFVDSSRPGYHSPESYQRPDTQTEHGSADVADGGAGAGTEAIDGGAGVEAAGDENVEIVVKVRGNAEEALRQLRMMGLDASVKVEPAEDKAAPPYFKTSFKQLVWRRSTVLAALMALQSISSDVLSKYSGLIEQNVFIALFLTMLTGTGGNAGNQSSALVIRGLSTGEINDKNAWKVVVRELLASSVIGIILGSVAFFRVIGTSGCSLTAAIIVSASTVAVVMAAIVGGTLVPLILDKFGMDPAHISSPVLATITDVSGVVLLCTVTSAALGMLP